jgi:hypothetical protein
MSNIFLDDQANDAEHLANASAAGRLVVVSYRSWRCSFEALS